MHYAFKYDSAACLKYDGIEREKVKTIFCCLSFNAKLSYFSSKQVAM